MHLRASNTRNMCASHLFQRGNAEQKHFYFQFGNSFGCCFVDFGTSFSLLVSSYLFFHLARVVTRYEKRGIDFDSFSNILSRNLRSLQCLSLYIFIVTRCGSNSLPWFYPNNTLYKDNSPLQKSSYYNLFLGRMVFLSFLVVEKMLDFSPPSFCNCMRLQVIKMLCINCLKKVSLPLKIAANDSTSHKPLRLNTTQPHCLLNNNFGIYKLQSTFYGLHFAFAEIYWTLVLADLLSKRLPGTFNGESECFKCQKNQLCQRKYRMS